MWTFLVPNLLARNAIADLLSLLIIPLAPTVMVIREQAVPVSLMSLTNVAYGGGDGATTRPVSVDVRIQGDIGGGTVVHPVFDDSIVSLSVAALFPGLPTGTE